MSDLNIRVDMAAQRLDGAPLRLLVELFEGSFALGDRSGVVALLAELDQRDAVLQLPLELLIGIDRALELLALAHDLLRGLGIVPQLGVLGAPIELGGPRLSGVPVKDASAGAQGPP